MPDAGFGRVTEAPEHGDRYLDHLLTTLAADGETPLAGLRVVVDCAHGAASEYAPVLLSRAGADVITVGAEPDGLNINAGCGSTSLGTLSAAVVEHRAHAGIAHDGDADRCLAVDATGQVIDGDQILAVLALALKDAGRLAANTVVATVMSNLGFRHAMRSAGIDVVRDAGRRPVPDRGDARRQVRARRRAVRPHHHARPRDDRRRPADRPAVPGRSRRARTARSPISPAS